MSRKRKTDHIVCEGSGGKCLRCGETWQPQLPMSLNAWVAGSKKFTGKHKNCPSPADTETKTQKEFENVR